VVIDIVEQLAQWAENDMKAEAIALEAKYEIERLREALREISCTCDTHCRFDGFELCDQWVARAALKETE